MIELGDPRPDQVAAAQSPLMLSSENLTYGIFVRRSWKYSLQGQGTNSPKKATEDTKKLCKGRTSVLSLSQLHDADTAFVMLVLLFWSLC